MLGLGGWPGQHTRDCGTDDHQLASDNIQEDDVIGIKVNR